MYYRKNNRARLNGESHLTGGAHADVDPMWTTYEPIWRDTRERTLDPSVTAAALNSLL